ncbi:hypothetical protein A3E42_02070 [Candidatus Gottesmanbacteria bacterium RIFCSPHIGHO2_12_FULL_40_13]|uniref:Nudix hydrolase domain-containing protein n=1 Tax=Candidatus Gottesmanbacteria bacterium RIFCSPHIGHO2_01_FULL_40_15 TaxID=1798376 RepID=A0A1F5YZY4_9BACT|nr:MAG: hypothetical protein A2777_05085 [Candidatus Gottesmanbacteria bacterium RIFCSPHIGHO2_01_FULL_40_15]OGG24868.1 MAG: hypothetical protein A3E42_02070 [Candidatus Gottesmanbacteria bacterium RIFCSPHIGHO2_12_FULL_40_13]OGG33703.1 MAG: hypothetical protein A3I80_05195 [Candidatus Gottesmanbacteria bacterium RIFCSPLOWO2_02_FULL_40_10]
MLPERLNGLSEFDINRVDGMGFLIFNSEGDILLGKHGPGNGEFKRLPGEKSIPTETKIAGRDRNMEQLMYRSLYEELSILPDNFNDNFILVDAFPSASVSGNYPDAPWYGIIVVLFYKNSKDCFRSRDEEIIEFIWQNPDQFMTDTQAASRHLVRHKKVRQTLELFLKKVI